MSIRLLEENEAFSRSSPLLLCSSLLLPILDVFGIDPCCHGFQHRHGFQHPKRTPRQHTTHMQPTMPRHSKVGFKVLYSIISNLSRSSGCLIHGDGWWRMTFSFRLLCLKWDTTKRGNSLRFTTIICKSIQYHVNPNSQHIFFLIQSLREAQISIVIQNAFSWFSFVKKGHGITKTYKCFDVFLFNQSEASPACANDPNGWRCWRLQHPWLLRLAHQSFPNSIPWEWKVCPFLHQFSLHLFTKNTAEKIH